MSRIYKNSDSYENHEIIYITISLLIIRLIHTQSFFTKIKYFPDMFKKHLTKYVLYDII